MDVEHVTAMHEAVDGELEFRVDPNRQWTFADAVRVGTALADHGVHLEYLAQPIEVNSFGTLATLRERLTQPIAINEDAYLPQNTISRANTTRSTQPLSTCNPRAGSSGLADLGQLPPSRTSRSPTTAVTTSG